LLAAVYLCALAVQFNKVLAAVYLNADSASAPVIGSFAGHGSGGIVLGKLPWYSALIFELATRGLPLHRQLWEVAPYAMALASVALIADSLRRVSGRLAAVFAAAILVCASPQLLGLLFALDDHSPTWFTIALLGWWVVMLERVKIDSLARSLALLAGGVVIALVTGMNAASDSLLLAGGLVPLVLAPAVAYALDRGAAARNAAIAAGATCALAVTFALITARVMHEHNVTHAGIYMFGEPAHVQGNLTLWWEGLVFIGNGNFFGAAIGFTSILASACALIVLAAAVGALRFGWLELSGRRMEAEVRSTDSARAAHIAFWLTTGLAITLVFIVSAEPEGLPASRYLVGVLYAVVALVVLLVERRPAVRAAVLGAVIVYCLGGTIAMARGILTESGVGSPSDHIAGEVAALAKREHLTRGYAGYWDAAPITWSTHLRVHVFPVWLCPQGLCQFYLHTVASWYRPHPGERTFLLTDSGQPFLQSPPALLGPPVATHSVGPDTMYVYPYDIATRISPP